MFTSSMMKMILKNRCKKRHLGGVEWFELNAAETEINYRRNYQESNLHPTSSTQAYKHFINPTTSISSSNFHNYFSNFKYFFIPIVQECCQPNLENISASISSTQSYKFLSTQSNKYFINLMFSIQSFLSKHIVKFTIY